MGERKVLNKYYPPDYDAEKLQRLEKVFKNEDKKKSKKKGDVEQIRLMLPFTIRCSTCGEFMRTGTKFNAQKEIAKGMEYLNIRRIRFRIKCEVCKSFLTFLTDPKNSDFEMETGGTRSIDLRYENKLAAREAAEAKLETDNLDSMGKLESRTLDSKKEMDILDALEGIQKQNRRREKQDLDAVLGMSSNDGEPNLQTDDNHPDQDEEAAIAEFRKQKEAAHSMGVGSEGEEESESESENKAASDSVKSNTTSQSFGLSVELRVKKRKLDGTTKSRKKKTINSPQVIQGLGLAYGSDSE